MKALALGAHAVLIGRATLYGIAAGGEAGATRAIELLREEIDRTLALLGCRNIAALDRIVLLTSRREGNAMAEGIKPIRRVVTGNDAQGRSCVLYDSAAPRVKASAFKKGTGMTDIWMYETSPAPISGTRDDGDLPFHFEPPDNGGRLRIVQSDARQEVYHAAKDEYITPEHPPKKTEGGTWERGRQNLYTTRIHKSETLDYGIVSTGERVLVTDGGET